MVGGPCSPEACWGPGSGQEGCRDEVWYGKGTSKNRVVGKEGGWLDRVVSLWGGLLMGNGSAVENGASPHSGLGSGGVAFPAEHVAIQGEAAVVIRLNGQRLPTVLTLVALHVEVLVQRDHTHGLLAARLWHDGLCADGAPGAYCLW